MNMKPRTNIRRMNMIQKSVFSIASLLLAMCATAQETVSQKDIDLVRYMPERPSPYKMTDWKAIAMKQDSLLFDSDAPGTFLPLIWWDTTTTKIGRAHIWTTVTYAQLVSCIPLEKNK